MKGLDFVSEYDYSIFTGFILTSGNKGMHCSEYYSEFLSGMSDSMICQLIAKFFNDSYLMFSGGSDDEVAESLRYIIDPGKSDLMCRAVSSSDMVNLFSLIDSFFSVYEGLFLNRCSKNICHNDSVALEEINVICYMWWDIIPIRFSASDNENHKAINSHVISLLEKIIKLNHVACIESALHGLGHWYSTNPSKVEKVIADQWGFIPRALHAYARCARRGDVV